VAIKFALLISRRGAMLTIASVVTALIGAKTGTSLHVAGFWDGPH
jgi:hypothetical protein